MEMEVTCIVAGNSATSAKALRAVPQGHATPGMCVMIPPGVRHRAIGEMKVLIVVLPKFDPVDEWFD